MTNITLSKKTLLKRIGKHLSDEELEDRITMLGTALEKIDGDEILVDIFPNRPDLLSEAGLARALSAFIGIKTGLREYHAKQGGSDYRIIIDESVKEVRPYTACAIVKGLHFDDEKIREIIQLQEKLHITFGRNRKRLAIGIYPLEKITLPINYLALLPREIKFRPLEAQHEMNGEQILEQHPAGREYAHLLEGKKHYPIFRDAKNQILSMPPIINSHLTGKVTENTKDVFIECSGFDMRVLKQCLNIIVTSLAELGGEIYEMKLEYGNSNKHEITPCLAPEEWALDIEYINKMTGLKLKETEIKPLVEKMGHSYKNKKVLVPCYRTDILHQIDLAEDVAIAYGYDNFEPEIPNVSTVGEEDGLEVFKSRIANILIGFGLIETNSYNLANKENHNTKMCHETELVEVANAVTKEYSVLRSWMLPGLMQILSENTNREYPQNIFEIGNIFTLQKQTESGVAEKYSLGLAICGADVDFTNIKQVLDILFAALNTNYYLKETTHSSFIKGRTANILLDKKEIGIIGEIQPQVLSNFNIQMPVVGLEIDIAELYELLKK